MEKCWETLGQLVRVVMAAEGEKTSGTHWVEAEPGHKPEHGD